MSRSVQGASGIGPSLGRSGGDDTRPIALVDLLDRLLGTGVVLAGDVVISLAGVDLVELRLRALLRTVNGEERQ